MAAASLLRSSRTNRRCCHSGATNLRRHAPLPRHHRIRRHAVRRLADPGRRRLRAGPPRRGHPQAVGRDRDGARRRPHGCRRACAGPGRALRADPRLADRHGARGAQLPPQARSHRRASTARKSPTTSTRASARWPVTTATASWRGRRRPCSTATACGGCRSRCAPRRWQQARGAPGRPARLHDLPRGGLPGQVADQDARRAGGDAPSATRSSSRPPRAPSCTTRCARWWAR